MKYILVTGGSGFIGSNLCKYLLNNENNYVYCLDNLITGKIKNLDDIIRNNRFKFFEYDITSADVLNALNFIKIDEIYHLASIASPPNYKKYSIETLMTSFQGTKNMLELSRKYKSKILFTSTSEVYGDPLVHPQNEEYFGNVNPFGERSCYDEGKRVAETLIYEYIKNYKVDAKIVRLFNTYGPFMDIEDGRVVTNFIKKILEDDSIYIYGDGTQTRSFCYIDDTIDALCKMMQSNESGPINIGNPYCEVTLNELVRLFEKIVCKKLSVTYLEATEDDPKKRRPVIEKATRLLNWSPKVAIEDGLLMSYQFYYENKNNINRTEN